MNADTLITAFDRALRAAASVAPTAPMPVAARQPAPALTPAEQADAAARMRVNHVGEVCAQALYHGQAATAATPAVRAHMERAAADEGAHLSWTAQRIAELGGRVSLLNPLWYAGAFALGCLRRTAVRARSSRRCRPTRRATGATRSRRAGPTCRCRRGWR